MIHASLTLLAAAIIATLGSALQAAGAASAASATVPATLDAAPFGPEFPLLDGWATGDWWTAARAIPGDGRRGARWWPSRSTPWPSSPPPRPAP